MSDDSIIKQAEKERDNWFKEKQGQKGKKQVFYIADFPGLVDLVLSEDNEIKFLTSEAKLIDKVKIGDTIYNPPPKEKLPKNLIIPRASEVVKFAREHIETGETGDSGICRTCTQLYYDLIQYHQEISELPDPDLYHLIVCWDFHTHFIEKSNFSPIIYFYSVAERGKSRTLKGMLNVARRGIRKVDISDAQLLRDCTHLRATIGFDMMDFWDKVKQAGSVDVALNRYERGFTVSRINRSEKGAFQDVDYYDVFGPTILATNEIINDIAYTRAISIIMRKSHKEFENEVVPEDALPLKERLIGCRLAHFNDSLPQVRKIAKSRLGDITRPLFQILLKVNPQEEERFIKLVKKIEDTRLTDKSGSIDAEIIQAWMAVEHEIVNGVLANALVATGFNKDKSDKEQLTPRRIGNRLRAFGFQPTHTGNHTLGFFWDKDLTERLAKEYGVLPSETSESPEIPESPTETEAEEVQPKTCYICGNQKLWRRPDGGLVCALCHPPAMEEADE